MFEELALPLPQITEASASAEIPAEMSAEIDLAALVHTHTTLLFRVAHSLLRNRAEAEDTVQDTFLRVLQHRRKLATLRDPRPWLIRITWNLAMDRCRARRRGATPDQADDLFLQALVAPGTPHDQALHDAEQSRLVLHAIDRLPKPERQALLLAALEELATPEIAEIMGKSESAIRALLHRARTQLRTRLGKGEKL